jgi:hypothetical protein
LIQESREENIKLTQLNLKVMITSTLNFIIMKTQFHVTDLLFKKIFEEKHIAQVKWGIESFWHVTP